MVDKQTARFLVYGTLATLCLIMMVAVYAITQKGHLQQTLEEKLEELDKKQEDIERKRAQVLKAQKLKEEREMDFRRERHAHRVAETAAEEEKARLEHETEEKGHVQKEADELRKRARSDEDDHRDYLESLSDEELQKQLREEAEEFEREQADLNEEDLDGEESEDLNKQKQVGKNLEDQWKKVVDILGNEDSDPEAKKKAPKALERMEEFGEQNEVFLEDLARDAKRNKNGKWKEGTRPDRMQKLAHDLDERAEVLRQRYDERQLDDSQDILKKIKKDTAELMRKHAEEHGEPGAYQDERLRNMVDSVEQREKRLKLELLQADDMEAYAMAKALEEYSQEVQNQVADLERLAKSNETRLSPDDVKQHKEAMDYFERELQSIEAQAQEIEAGFERRAMRRQAVLMSKAANKLNDSPQLKKLKHGSKVLKDVDGILRSESDLLQDMKAGDKQRQHEHSEQLKEQSEEFEEDTGRLREEARAARFETPDEQSEARQVAKSLDDTAHNMQQVADNIGHSNDRREIRNEAHHIDLAAAKVRDAKPMQKLRKDWSKVHDDAKELDNDIQKEDWDAELATSKKAVEDIMALEKGAKDLEAELKRPKTPLTRAQRQQYMDAIKEMRGHAEILRNSVKNVRADIEEKAEKKAKHIKSAMKRLEHLVPKQHAPDREAQPF